MSLSEQDYVAQRAIYFAKYMYAKSPREAAEITAGTKFSDTQWNECRDAWERNWSKVPDPNSFLERTKRSFGLSKFS